MNVSQQLYHINDNVYDDEITVEGVPQGHFPAVVSINLPDGSTTRDIGVEIMPLPQSPGGTMPINSGAFVRKDGESDVKVTVRQDGKEVATNTTAYS